MKYMTPDLIARFRAEDDAVAEPAVEEWERRCEAYQAYLSEVRSTVPAGVRRLLRRYPLHDARVLSMAADEASHFSILLELARPADPRDKYLELRYRLVGGVPRGVHFVRHDSLAGDGKPLAWWMYDEMEVIGGAVPAVRHSILLSGGWELHLTFFTLSCRRLNFLFPPCVNEEGVIDPKMVESLIGITS